MPAKQGPLEGIAVANLTRAFAGLYAASIRTGVLDRLGFSVERRCASSSGTTRGVALRNPSVSAPRAPAGECRPGWRA